MTRRDQDSLIDYDAHSLLFGPDEENEPGTDERPVAASGGPTRRSRHAQAVQRRRRRNRRALLVLSLVAVLLVGVSSWLIVPKVLDVFSTPDYSGSGSGSVLVTVAQGDSAADIGAELQRSGVVKSQQAFIDAASANSAAQNIQPGTYTLHHHMSAASALELLLDPKARSTVGDLVIPEGATVYEVRRKLLSILGAGQRAAIDQALADPASLGIPLGYRPASGTFGTVEGFLYPATYTLDPKTAPSAALQRMTGSFAEHDRSIGFAAGAEKLGITPYQALIIASIAQSEAKYPQDMAKVARVILNRIAAHRPLQIDATTRYGALANGVAPDKLGTIPYHTYDSPYNSYTHAGLPPSPISNPGADAMQAVINAPAGNWMYYVNADAQGHLFFTNDEAAFARAKATCAENNWGCAAD